MHRNFRDISQILLYKNGQGHVGSHVCGHISVLVIVMAVWSWWWTLWSSRRWWQWKDEKLNLADASSMTKAMQEATKRDQERERPYSAPALCREESFFAQKNRSSVDYHHHYCILSSLPCADNDSARSNATSRKHWPIEEGSHLGEPIYQVASFFFKNLIFDWPYQSLELLIHPKGPVHVA